MSKSTRHTNSILFVLSILIILSITGCSNLGKNLSEVAHEKSASEEINENQLSNLMLEYIHFEQKDNTELEKIFISAKEKFELDSNHHNRFRYILLLTLSNPKFSDQAGALTLLKNWPQEEQLPTSLESFRRILIMRLEEEARLRNQLKNLTHQLANTKLNARTLQKKIDDIKNMEKSLIRRNLQ